eukprot:1318691-Pyramimonas_sp.AAC.1
MGASCNEVAMAVIGSKCTELRVRRRGQRDPSGQGAAFFDARWTSCEKNSRGTIYPVSARAFCRKPCFRAA